MTIHDICRTGTFVVDFLRRSKKNWHAKESTRPRAISIDLVFIEKSKENKAME